MRHEVLDAALEVADARRRLPSPPARRLIRETAGLTQKQIGDTLNVTPEAVSQWEAGTRTPRGAHLRDYLKILERLAAPGR